MCKSRWYSLALLVAAGCAPTVAPPPAPVPVPPRRSDPVTRPQVDSAPVAVARAVRTAPPPRFATLARPASRTDTLAHRPLHAPVRVCAGGDITLGTNLDTAWAAKAAERLRRWSGRSDDPDSLVAPLRPLFQGADVVLVNVESAIGEGPAPSKCGPSSTNCFAFRAPLASAAALRSLAPGGTVVGNLANNHAHDAGNAGQDSTVAALTRAGVLVTGDDTLPALVPLPQGDTIAVLGFHTSSETPDARDTAMVHRLVFWAADRYPVVIVTMHLGAEGRAAQRTLDSTERYLDVDRGNPVAFADAAVRGGAAMVVGHGPHVLRAMEWRTRGALIAYSLGNLLTYGPFKLDGPLARAAVLCATIDRSGRASTASLAPTVQRAPGLVARDRSRRALTLADSLGRLDFPVTAARVTSRGVLRAALPR